MIAEALRRGAEVFKNVGCTGKTDIIIARDGETLHLDVKTMKWDYAQQTFKSKGKSRAEETRVLVNPSTWTVRWVYGGEPTGWEDFWN